MNYKKGQLIKSKSNTRYHRLGEIVTIYDVQPDLIAWVNSPKQGVLVWYDLREMELLFERFECPVQNIAKSAKVSI